MEELPNQRRLTEIKQLADSDARIIDVLEKLCWNVDELRKRVVRLEQLSQK